MEYYWPTHKFTIYKNEGRQKKLILITGHVEGNEKSTDEMKEWFKEYWIERECLLTYKLRREKNMPQINFKRFHFRTRSRLLL